MERDRPDRRGLSWRRPGPLSGPIGRLAWAAGPLRLRVSLHSVGPHVVIPAVGAAPVVTTSSIGAHCSSKNPVPRPCMLLRPYRSPPPKPRGVARQEGEVRVRTAQRRAGQGISGSRRDLLASTIYGQTIDTDRESIHDPPPPNRRAPWSSSPRRSSVCCSSPGPQRSRCSRGSPQKSLPAFPSTRTSERHSSRW